MMRLRILLALLAIPLGAQTQDFSFFEAKIRPVLAENCYACHSSKASAPMGGLRLDTKAGLIQGGVRGPAVAPGDPEASLLLEALSYTDNHLQMPPSGKLPDSVIADFKQWIASGAPDPRESSPTVAQDPPPLKGMSIEDGKKWWAYQPVAPQAAPQVQNGQWAKTKIDSFVLSKLEEKGLTPSPAADADTLVRRAYVDLVGMKPTYEEVQQFVNDKSPDAYANLIEKLLASPHYGERWGRHWMDVARYAEDNPTSEATNPPYPFAWRYRDWIIEAMNDDVPYDRFVKLQLAADSLPGAKREDMRALGYLGAAPVYHKDQRLSYDVIYTFLTDDWDERVDAVSRGLLGMTVACARCHDHKFDPIPTKDYYGLAGVFASTMRAERPMFDVEPEVERRYLYIQNRLFDLRYSANLLTNEASTVDGAAARVEKWKAEIQALKAEMEEIGKTYPQLEKSLEKFWTEPVRRAPRPPAPPVNENDPEAVAAAKAAAAERAAAARSRRRRPLTSTEPFMNAVYDAAQYVDGSDPNYTFVTYKPGEARDLPVMRAGSVSNPGDVAPRHFLTVLSDGDSTFKNGSGRLELAEKIFTDGAPLSARVIVNRVWGWHFGEPLVATTSDFGVQGDKPTHPALLDDLAARFIEHGWSLKWLHREIMLSAAYRQASHPRDEAAAVDQTNTLLWRMNPRRVDIEVYRDSILRASGNLDETMYGPSENLDQAENHRRTVYGRVGRGRLSNVLGLYDFPDPTQTSPGRDLTTSSLQQLFVMNSDFMHDQAVALAAQVNDQPDAAAKTKVLFRKILARDPTPQELDLALTYLANATVEQYAQVLLSTNEEIFWP
jgi:hypothetical protein